MSATILPCHLNFAGTINELDVDVFKYEILRLKFLSNFQKQTEWNLAQTVRDYLESDLADAVYRFNGVNWLRGGTLSSPNPKMNLSLEE